MGVAEIVIGLIIVCVVGVRFADVFERIARM